MGSRNGLQLHHVWTVLRKLGIERWGDDAFLRDQLKMRQLSRAGLDQQPFAFIALRATPDTPSLLSTPKPNYRTRFIMSHEVRPVHNELENKFLKIMQNEASIVQHKTSIVQHEMSITQREARALHQQCRRKILVSTQVKCWTRGQCVGELCTLYVVARIPVAVVVELIVGRHRDESAPRGAHRVENLHGSFTPHL